MWGGTQPDSGGEDPLEAPTSNQELKDLKDQFDQQQVLIAQLKEMLRKSEQTAVMQEKVEEYANTLTRMNARVKKSKLKRDTEVTDSSISIDTPAKGKILLLRQQMEENKLKLAERGKLHKGIEESVTQLKAQLDDSQQLISQTSFNLSLTDSKDENYSLNSSPEELLNFLVIKDRRISDLNAKVHKLEASVLDLQENVKEKDSVIDARTKAITLMTESLSKKGKTTLDALDDTKEQMRKMQENFINLEDQMNREKQSLTEQLTEKVVENERLEKACTEQKEELQGYKNVSSPKKGKKGKRGQKLQKSIDESSSEHAECEVHLSQIAQYEATISELSLTIEELKSIQAKPLDNELSQNADILKLKKQVDENNKNMIKIKAQNKSKIKDLNKTIEELKKGRDGSLEIKRLQEENIKLHEQITKLTLNKDLATSEHVNDLEMKLIEQSELVETKNQTISTLEEQINLYKAQVGQLEKFSRLENDQVVSEIRSIDFEEQLDKVELEKTALLQKYDEIVAEKLTLLETIDNLTKEKQEISLKLDSYIQENIELIDKLEKLSSAKVSSAESIEIVEGLTQQEKLELEEYQKGLEVPENIKGSVENLESPGLNESVNQLTEETSDLLRKIELFTEERREVMDKMEALTVENSQLSMKICEIENNRDILAETYEQIQNEKEDLEVKLNEEQQKMKELESKIGTLQETNKILQERLDSELQNTKNNDEVTKKIRKEDIIPLHSPLDLQSQIDEYKNLIEIQIQEIHELKLELLSQQHLSTAHSNLQEELAALQSRYHALLSENEALIKSVKESSEILHEKDELEVELVDARKRINEFSEKLKENLDEIENYKAIVEENKNELISSANIIGDLQNEVQSKHNEITNYEAETERLNSVIMDLNSRIASIDNETAQSLDNMETMEIMSNQLQELKEILNENIIQIEKYEEEVQTNTDTINQLNLQLKDLKNKLLNMEHEMESKDDEIARLLKEQKEKESLIVTLQSDLKEKHTSFHEACEKLKEKCLSLQNKIDANSGSLDRINLPKVQELESKNKEQLEKMKKIAASLKKKNAAYQEIEQKYNDLDDKYKILNNDTTLKDQEIEQLKAQSIRLRNLTAESELRGSNECNDLNLEINQKNNLIKTLNDELEGLRYHSETNSNALHVKIQELEMFIETQDGELNKYKDKVNRLEEGLSALEERRLSLERQTVELGHQLQEKSNSYEEISQIEDILEQRLATLMAQDKKMEKRLRESIIENQNLQVDNKYLNEENDQLKLKLAHSNERNVDANKIVDMENEIQRLSDSLNKAEQDSKRHYAEYEIKLTNKTIEVENMELELQGQLEYLTGERKTLMIQCEQLNDQIKEHLEAQEILQDSIEDYKNKLTQQQSDFEDHIIIFQKVNDENKNNMTVIDQLNEQVLTYTTEIESLNKSLSEKYAEIENCHIQSMQLQSSCQNLQEQYDMISKQLHEVQTTNSEMLEKINQVNIGAVPDDSEKKSAPEQTVTTFVWPDQTSSDPFDSIISAHSNNDTTPQQSHECNKTSQYFEPQAREFFEPKTFKNVESQTFPNENVEDFLGINTQTGQKITTDGGEMILEHYENPDNLPCIEVSAHETTQPLLESQRSNDDTIAELLDKIKTLEFMLYSVEKEKEDVLSQCQELTGQIAQLIYENQACSPNERGLTSDDCKQPQKLEIAPVIGQSSSTNAATILESQIVSCDDALITQGDLQQLQCIEFGKYEGHKASEDVCQAKTAYLCYPVDTTKLESQIVTSQEAKITKENLQQLQNIEFTKCKDVKDVTPQNCPISETMEAKTTYLCFKPDDAFDENDDGWGCGSDEAKLEADYHHQQQVDHNISYISELNERINVLEVECENHRLENKQAQIKSGKLLKKLKEYKVLNDKLEAQLRKSGEFADLDDALQDEFKTQIAQLEKRLKDINLDIEKERNEKINLIKRLDILQVANERMVEMKEKQDIEMLTWQRQNRELSSKLEQFEWGSGDSESPKHEQRQPDDKVVELTAIINELTKDNDELQVLLEEQRNLRITAEKSKVDGIREEEYLNIVVDTNNLKEELASSVEEKKALQDQLNNVIRMNDEIQGKLALVDKEKLVWEEEIADKVNSIAILTEELDKTRQNASEQDNLLLQNSLQDLHNKNLQLLENKLSFEQNLEKLKEYEIKLTSYEQKIVDVTEQLNLKTNELLETTNKLEVTLNEKTSLEQSIEVLNNEWSQRVDQRGFDIAESWKLHLETRETEFSQLEQLSKKELYEFEEKCNALVNENNELRKNVDAEIRNEVDKISALQQQINDRQLYINDLSRIVQEKQAELDQQQTKITEYDVLVKQISDEKVSLELEIVEKSQKIAELEQKLLSMNDLQNKLDKNDELLKNFELQVNEKQKIIDNNLRILNQSNAELDEYKETVNSFQQQMESKEEYISELAREAHENLTQVKLLQEEIKHKNSSLQECEALLHNQTEINDVEQELNGVKSLLSTKENEFKVATLERESLLNVKIQELDALKNVEHTYTELLSVKESELENTKLQLQEVQQKGDALINEYYELERTLNDFKLKFDDKIHECEELRKKVYEQDLLYSEESKQISELGVIIEDQVFKIEELKHELYEKSKDYDSLIAELDIRKPSMVEHVSLPPELLKESQVQGTSSTPVRSDIHSNYDSLEPVSRAELDLALYMLHQRDVRCEELTVELMQLLEERDTLQLKLSNAIREREDLRKSYIPSQSPIQTDDNEGTTQIETPTSPSKVSAIVLGASGTEIASEAVEGSNENRGPLATKLLELKTVGYRRDKTLLNEQERRHFQQLALMQEHRDLAAFLPPEAAARLVQDANYTLSRDVQSPSKVLLNWLWGKGTPKVNNV